MQDFTMETWNNRLAMAEHSPCNEIFHVINIQYFYRYSDIFK